MRIKGQESRIEEDVVILEYPFTIFVNDEEIITLLCSPSSLKELMVGFLFSEGFLNSLEDIDRVRIDEDKGLEIHLFKGCK